MKYLVIISLIFLFACKPAPTEETITVENTDSVSVATEDTSASAYDSLLAKKYDADQYGMKEYVMAFLKTGPKPPTDSAHAMELQAAHMANIGRLAEEGKLVLAGPFYGDAQGDFRGIYIFNTASIDSARSYTATDPAIEYGSLKMELINWYGSAALMGVNETHMKLSENPI